MSTARAVSRLPATPATRPPVSPSPQAVPRRGLGGGLPAPASRASATRHASASHGGVAPAGGGDQASSSRAGHQRTGPWASRPDNWLFLPRLRQAVFLRGEQEAKRVHPSGNRALPVTARGCA